MSRKITKNVLHIVWDWEEVYVGGVQAKEESGGARRCEKLFLDHCTQCIHLRLVYFHISIRDPYISSNAEKEKEILC